MIHKTDRRVIVSSNSLQATVEQVLACVILKDDVNVHQTQDAETTSGGNQVGSFLLGYGVEAEDLPTLIMKAIEEINALAVDQKAAIIACDISGLRPTGEGHRLWGKIECIASANGPDQSTWVDAITYEHPDSGTWQITARIIDKEPL